MKCPLPQRPHWAMWHLDLSWDSHSYILLKHEGLKWLPILRPSEQGSPTHPPTTATCFFCNLVPGKTLMCVH